MVSAPGGPSAVHADADREVVRPGTPAAHRPAGGGLTLVHAEGDSVTVSWRGAELLRYVYAPWEDALESPKPFFHPLRTLSGELVSLYRPHDHIWHKGLYFGISNYGEHNVWGGHTYLPGEGYRTLPNQGRIRHLGFGRLEVADGVLHVAERLRWEGAVDGGGLPEFPAADEHRSLTVRVLEAERAWVLGFATALTNRSGRTVALGSPTTKGRPMAGYGGLFWRGPRSFTGTGEVVVPSGVGGDELMGHTGPWMALRGRHDGEGAASTLLFVDRAADPRLPSRWFVRVTPYACLGTAPFFDREHPFAPGDTIRFEHEVIVAEGLLTPERCAALADPDRRW
jgi:Methane oxygenase PmoA